MNWRAFTDPYFAARVTTEEATAILLLQGANATVTDLTVEVLGVASHPEDDLVLSTALSGHAELLCTRDKQLLKLRTHAGIRIVSPGELLGILKPEPLA